MVSSYSLLLTDNCRVKLWFFKAHERLYLDRHCLAKQGPISWKLQTGASAEKRRVMLSSSGENSTLGKQSVTANQMAASAAAPAVLNWLAAVVPVEKRFGGVPEQKVLHPLMCLHLICGLWKKTRSSTVQIMFNGSENRRRTAGLSLQRAHKQICQKMKHLQPQTMCWNNKIT